MFILLFKTHLFKMRLNAAERESFQKRLEVFFVKNSNIKNSETLNRFEKEGIARNTAYDNLKELETGQSLSDKKHSGCSTSWTREKKVKLKRLVNNLIGVSRRKLDLKFGVNHSTICCQYKQRIFNTKSVNRLPNTQFNK